MLAGHKKGAGVKSRIAPRPVILFKSHLSFLLLKYSLLYCSRAAWCSCLVCLRFRVDPLVPQGGDERLDLVVLIGWQYVGLRSQSLAYPTLRYGALSGRRAVS